MNYEVKHYRLNNRSCLGTLIGIHLVDAPNASAAMAASRQLSEEVRPATDYAVLKDDAGSFICGWGLGMEAPAATSA